MLDYLDWSLCCSSREGQGRFVLERHIITFKQHHVYHAITRAALICSLHDDAIVSFRPKKRSRVPGEPAKNLPVTPMSKWRARECDHTAVSHWKLGLKWKLGSHYCVIESFFTAYLLCISFILISYILSHIYFFPAIYNEKYYAFCLRTRVRACGKYA